MLISNLEKVKALSGVDAQRDRYSSVTTSAVAKEDTRLWSPSSWVHEDPFLLPPYLPPCSLSTFLITPLTHSTPLGSLLVTGSFCLLGSFWVFFLNYILSPLYLTLLSWRTLQAASFWNLPRVTHLAGELVVSSEFSQRPHILMTVVRVVMGFGLLSFTELLLKAPTMCWVPC